MQIDARVIMKIYCQDLLGIRSVPAPVNRCVYSTLYGYKMSSEIMRLIQRSKYITGSSSEDAMAC